MTFEMKKLMFVVAVATFPIACGTTSVTGPDAATLAGNDGGFSAFRLHPLPPTAPAPSSPNTVPEPTVPTKDDPGVDVPASPGSVPVEPAHNTQRPTPSQPGSPNVSAPGPLPTPAPSDPGTPMPADPGGVPTGEVQCLAASIDIVQTVLFAGTPGATLEAIMNDDKGVVITDGSCDKVEWHAEASGPGAGDGTVQITSGANARFATLTGTPGEYKVGAVAINGTGASIVISIQ